MGPGHPPLTVTFNIQLSRGPSGRTAPLVVAVPWSVEDQKVHKKVEAAQKVLKKVLYYMSLEDDVWRTAISRSFWTHFVCVSFASTRSVALDSSLTAMAGSRTRPIRGFGKEKHRRLIDPSNHPFIPWLPEVQDHPRTLTNMANLVSEISIIFDMDSEDLLPQTSCSSRMMSLL